MNIILFFSVNVHCIYNMFTHFCGHICILKLKRDKAIEIILIQIIHVNYHPKVKHNLVKLLYYYFFYETYFETGFNSSPN